MNHGVLGQYLSTRFWSLCVTVTCIAQLHEICCPLFEKVPRTIGGYTVFTANIVTYSRTLLVIPIAYCMRMNLTGWACLLVLWHDTLDHVDGIVAKAQINVGYKDDSQWGSFVDAFCDKIVFIFSLWTILIVLGYEREPVWLSWFIISVSAALIFYEFAIGAIRVNDYYYEYFQQNSGSKKKLKGTLISIACEQPFRRMILMVRTAVMEGKLKQKFESFGIAFLALGLPYPSKSIATPVGLICLLMATYLAHQSLAHKLSAYPQFHRILGNVKPPE
eukprot:gb/GECG01014116.1/.p1 GENE.gb/GECG01014116.1/~~gb/GECG01014116.1/.p1  ORF type:complete len:276 (+),score=10.42 gb/GECG01014116.1/:1-828(+)